MATSSPVSSVRKTISNPAVDRGNPIESRHVALFVCSMPCWSASLLGGKACRARFRRSTRRSIVGQVHTRCDATQHAHFGRCSSHFIFRLRHVRQPVFVRNEACEVGDGFIMGRMRTSARIGTARVSCSCPVHVDCLA